MIQEMPYYTRTRVVFQSRTRFWNTDKVSPNWVPPDPRLNELWSMAEEVNTPRGILLGGAQAGVGGVGIARGFPKALPREVGRHRAGDRARLVERPLGGHVRAHCVQAGPTRPVLAGSGSSLRARFISPERMPRRCPGDRRRPWNRRIGLPGRSIRREIVEPEPPGSTPVLITSARPISIGAI